MKKFSLIIAALVFSASLMAQPFPTTFKSVQVTGSYEAVVKQLEVEGMHEGEESVLKIEINENIDQVCSLTINRSNIERDTAEDISEKFNAIYEKFEKDPKYTADRANKKAKESLFDPSISIGLVFQAKFYQDGDPNRLVELNIRRYQVKYHYKEIKYINCYNQGKF